MKLINLLLTLSILCLITSCSKGEADIPRDVDTTTETLTYKLVLPDGVPENTASEWFNQLSEEEIKEYLIKDVDMITTRSCQSWSAWSNWVVYDVITNCYSRCPNSQSQDLVKKRRTRTRVCSWGIETQVQESRKIICFPPC